MDWVVGCILILIGAAMLFWGYRLFRVWLAIIGFIIGAVIGNSLGNQYLPGDVFPIIATLGIGLALALLAFSLYRIGAILTGAFIGAILASMIFGLFDIAPAWWIYLIGAIPGGILAGMLVEPYIKIASSFNGSYLVMVGVFSLIQGTSLISPQQEFLPRTDYPWYFYGGLVILAVIGMVVQFSTTKGHKLGQSTSAKNP